MTIAHIVNTFCFILPCFALLLLTFRNHLRTPVFLHITGAILAYLVITFYGSDTYADYASFPLKYLTIGLVSIILGAVIFDMSTGYRLGHGIFIVAITKCYTEHVTLLSMYVFFLLKNRLPSFNTFDASIIRISLTVITFPLIYYFFRRFLRPALDYTTSFSIWNQVWIIPICSNLLHNLLFSRNISSPDSIPDSFFYYILPLWVILTFATYVLIIRMVSFQAPVFRHKSASHNPEAPDPAYPRQDSGLPLFQMRQDSHHNVHPEDFLSFVLSL